MEIWECLYNARSESMPFVSPHISQPGKYDLEEFIKTFEPTPEQKEQFQNLLIAYYINAERNGFRDGLKTALRLYSE